MKNFIDIPEERIIYREEHFFVIKDGFPVAPGHCLIISNNLRETFFDLTSDEKQKLPSIISYVKNLIEKEYSPDGYNIGMNCGEVSGQTVMHFHCHVIPRYNNDMDDPRGGVRGVIPDKMKY